MELLINGVKRYCDFPANAHAVFALRNELDLKGVRMGCGEGHCGSFISAAQITHKVIFFMTAMQRKRSVSVRSEVTATNRYITFAGHQISSRARIR